MGSMDLQKGKDERRKSKARSVRSRRVVVMHAVASSHLPVLVDFLRFAYVLIGNTGPLFGEIHHRLSVHQAVAEFVTD